MFCVSYLFYLIVTPFVPISELTTGQKAVRVLWHYFGKVVLLLAFLYVFICSLSFLGDSFQLLGGKK